MFPLGDTDEILEIHAGSERESGCRTANQISGFLIKVLPGHCEVFISWNRKREGLLNLELLEGESQSNVGVGSTAIIIVIERWNLIDDVLNNLPSITNSC